MDIDKMSLRELQKESARALSVIDATNNNIYQFNKNAYHDSQNWYKSVIKWYVETYGNLPSKIGPAKHIKILVD